MPSAPPPSLLALVSEALEFGPRGLRTQVRRALAAHGFVPEDVLCGFVPESVLLDVCRRAPRLGVVARETGAWVGPV